MKRRDPDTVYTWLRRYREQGIRGLSNKPGRGRKPAFSPKSPEEAESELLVAIGQDPGLVNQHQTRWTLRSLGSGCAVACGSITPRHSSDLLTLGSQL